VEDVSERHPGGSRIEDIAVPIRTLDPEDEDWSDLEPLRNVIGDARVVGIGESAHGVADFHQLRHRILRFLVTELGFSALGTEFGFPDGLAVQQWISGGIGELGDVAPGGRILPFGEGAESRALLHWMRGWNAKSDNQLSFYGLDIPGSLAPEPAVRACLSRLPSMPGDDGFLKLSYFGGRFDGLSHYKAMPDRDRERLAEQVATLVGRAEKSGDEIAVRCARAAVATLRLLDGMGLGDAKAMAQNPREEFMAETAEWVLRRESRLVIGAHNGHVGRAPLMLPTLGGLLQGRLDRPPVTIGTTYGSGVIWDIENKVAPTSEWKPELVELLPPEQSLDGLMAQAGLPLHLVDVKRLSDEMLAGSPNMLVFNMAIPVDVRASFDAIVHVEHVRYMDDSYLTLCSDLSTDP